MIGVENLPNALVERHKGWHSRRYTEDKAWYQRLANEGQRPRYMMISCCDSRVDPISLFGAEPGEIFMLRNVANIVPPYKPDHEHHGTSAAIEYAVTALKVANIVVMGHAHCGGVEAFHDACANPEVDAIETGDFIPAWLEVIRPAFDEVADDNTSRTERLKRMEQRAVITSLQNLATFPFIQQAVKEGNLCLHGAWFNISEGKIHAYNPETDMFLPIV